MIAAVPTIMVDVGSALIFLGVIVATSKLPPVQWLFRTLVAGPATRWLDERNAVALKPLQDAVAQHRHYVEYHLGPNDTTRPVHERIKNLEDANGVPRQTMAEGAHTEVEYEDGDEV